ALELTDPAARVAYLDHVCGSDAALRERVETLLRAHAGAAPVLEPTAVGVTAVFAPGGRGTVDLPGSDSATATFGDTPPRPERSAAVELGTVIAGRYTLVEVIGEGGMGSVYLASQTAPVKRQVALKLIKSGMDSKAVLARFDAERQALALMDHPNI